MVAALIYLCLGTVHMADIKLPKAIHIRASCDKVCFKLMINYPSIKTIEAVTKKDTPTLSIKNCRA